MNLSNMPGNLEYDDIEAAYEPLSPCSSTHSGDLALANWGSIAFEDLLYTDEGLQDIVKSFRAAVIAAIKNRDFDEAHTKAEEQAKFLRDYIRRCQGAEHVCCDSEDYEQAQKIAKAIKYAMHIKKVTSERGGLAFGAVRRVQELLVKYRRHIENTRLEMKEAGEARNYTKAIALQHDLETCKNDYALKLCAHVDRVLESGNLRALEVATKSIQDAQPELQPDIMNVDLPEEDQAEPSSGMEGPAMIAAPPGTARRPHSARSAREVIPERHRFDGSIKLKQEQTAEMAKRLAIPKKTMEEKATTADELQKGKFMLQEEFENCTFRPTIGVKGVKKPSIAKKGGTFWPTDRYPRRAPSPHGKARFEGDINLDPDGTTQMQRCINFCVQHMQTQIQKHSTENIHRVTLEGCCTLINLALEDEGQVREWMLTDKELIVLKDPKLVLKDKVFQLTDDLRAKLFLKRAEAEVIKAKVQYEKGRDDMKKVAAENEAKIKKYTGPEGKKYKIADSKYLRLKDGVDTPGRQKRNKAMEDMLKGNQTPRPDMEEVRAVVADFCQYPKDEQLLQNIVELVQKKEQCQNLLKCDEKEADKLRSIAGLNAEGDPGETPPDGDRLLRMVSSLTKRAKFVSRMDSYNYKTRS